MNADEPAEDLDDPCRTDTPGHVDGETLAGVLIHDRQALQLLAVRTGIEHEVVGPNVPYPGGRQRARPSAGYTPAGPFTRHLKAGLPPDPMGSIGAHELPATLEEHLYASIPVAWILSRQLAHCGQHRRVTLDQS